jgi:(p)ppGpp synthase/HD superfamily hydrolase
MSELTEKAEAFCIAAHEAIRQKRKYTGLNYYTHPIEVASMVREVGGTEEMVAAAYLHDVVEDTGVCLQYIDMIFGGVVGNYVKLLTDVSKPEDGNRAARKKIDRDHIAKAPPEVQTIKLADLISNSRSIEKHDPEFAKVYMKEKSALLEVLCDGDESLYKVASEIVKSYFEREKNEAL